MDRKIHSTVILETEERLDITFNDLQMLKGLGLADYKARILHNRGELLPAGAYNDFDTFACCYHAINAIKPEDNDSMDNARNTVVASLESMSEEERLHAYNGWDSLIKKRAEMLSQQNTK